MRTIKTTNGVPIVLDGDLLSVMEALYREVTAKREEKRLKSSNDELENENSRLQADLKKKKEELTSLKANLNPTSADSASTESSVSPTPVWWWVAGGTLAAIALVAGVWWVGSRSEPATTAESETAAKPQNAT